jgi:hypothetical protein
MTRPQRRAPSRSSTGSAGRRARSRRTRWARRSGRGRQGLWERPRPFVTVGREMDCTRGRCASCGTILPAQLTRRPHPESNRGSGAQVSRARETMHAVSCQLAGPPRCSGARAGDRPTDLGAVKAGELAGFCAEIAFADRPCTARAEQVIADGLTTRRQQPASYSGEYRSRTLK